MLRNQPLLTIRHFNHTKHCGYRQTHGCILIDIINAELFRILLNVVSQNY